MVAVLIVPVYKDPPIDRFPDICPDWAFTVPDIFAPVAVTIPVPVTLNKPPAEISIGTTTPPVPTPAVKVPLTVNVVEVGTDSIATPEGVVKLYIEFVNPEILIY